MTDKTLKTLEQRAREAWVNDASVSPSDEDCFAAYVSGYLAAAREAEQEIEFLKSKFRASVECLKMRDAEISALRARVTELEGMVPRWVLENESALLNEQGWSVSETDKLGNGPRLWLMVPPTPLPEDE